MSTNRIAAIMFFASTAFLPGCASAPTPAATGAAASDTTVVFTNDFSSNCMYTSDSPDRTFRCERGEFTILSKGPKRTWWAHGSDRYNDAVIEADARIITGTADVNFGITFRTSSDGNSFYLLTIAPGFGTYSVLYHANGKWNALIPFTPSRAIKMGLETNRLKIIAQRNQMAFYVNGQFLNKVADSSLSDGRVGFALESPDSDAKAAFANLSISKINRTLALP